MLDSVKLLAAVLTPRQTVYVPPDVHQGGLQPGHISLQSILGLLVHTGAVGGSGGRKMYIFMSKLSCIRYK